MIRKMSRRDQFALAAMQGWLASFSGPSDVHPANNSDNPNAAGDVARISYLMADAMLEESEEHNDEDSYDDGGESD